MPIEKYPRQDQLDIDSSDAVEICRLVNLISAGLNLVRKVRLVLRSGIDIAVVYQTCPKPIV